jgi:integrase
MTAHQFLSYVRSPDDAMRAVMGRSNEALSANWSLHDLRHTAAMRMQEDPNMRLTDIQSILGHASILTTQKYLRPREVEVFTKAQAHFQWLRDRSTAPADEPTPGVPTIASEYSEADMNELFGPT